MGVVRAFLAMEVRFRIATAALSRRLARTVLRLDALRRGPKPRSACRRARSDRSIEASSPWAAPARPPGTWPRCAFQQPVAVLREHRMAPDGVVDADPDEPAEQQIVFQPLHQKPLRADRIKHLQQHRPRPASPAGPTAVQSANGARKTRVPASTAPRSQWSGSLAADDRAVPAPRGQRS